MSKSRQTCCINGCSNTPSNTKKNNPRISFYSFPQASVHAPRKTEKRKLWISAIQEHLQLKNWKPSSNARICSAHFINNNKVEDPNHPSYVPTIFPNTQSKNCQQLCKEIHQDHNHLNNHSLDNGENLDIKTHEIYVKTEMFDKGPSIKVESINSKFDVECQTDFIETSEDVPSINSFSCVMKKKENICTAQLQVDINVKKSADKMSSADISLQQNSKDVGINTISKDIEDECSSGFHGIRSVKDDEQLTDLAGIPLITFNYLLKLIPDTGDIELSKPNKLLLTLMKLKTGMEFCALAIFFQINEHSAYKIFIVLLDHLHNILKKFISWPSKEIVKSSLPDIFKNDHPNTRIINEYVEIIIQKASNINDQEITPFQYQNMTTAKFLVGSTPSGLICFVSKCYAGTKKDSFITKDSGLLDLLEPGDVVMCNKESSNVCMDVLSYIERLNQRISDFYIFSGIPTNLLPYMDRIALIVCALINAKPSTIQKLD